MNDYDEPINVKGLLVGRGMYLGGSHITRYAYTVLA